MDSADMIRQIQLEQQMRVDEGEMAKQDEENMTGFNRGGRSRCPAVDDAFQAADKPPAEDDALVDEDLPAEVFDARATSVVSEAFASGMVATKTDNTLLMA